MSESSGGSDSGSDPGRAGEQAGDGAATGGAGSRGTGLLVMAYGTASSPEEIEPYYTHIRRGRKPPPELIAELAERYAALPGGHSPLLEITTAQMEALARSLRAAGVEPLVPALGQKHAPPFIEDGVERLAEAGVERILALVLAPHWSTMSVAEYLGRARDHAAKLLPRAELTMVEDWHLAAGYVEWLAGAVGEALESLPPEDRGRAEVIFTAHSLPVRILEEGDPYPESLRETAEAVVERAGIEHWSVAWQSAGRTADPWLGPDILEVIPELPGRDRRAAVVCACGFVADHLEVMYDLDIEAAEAAAEAGLAFARTAMPNDDPEFIGALHDVVLAQLGSAKS